MLNKIQHVLAFLVLVALLFCLWLSWQFLMQAREDQPKVNVIINRTVVPARP